MRQVFQVHQSVINQGNANQSREVTLAVGRVRNGAPNLILPERNPLTLPRRPVASTNTPADPLDGKYLAVLESNGDSETEIRSEIELTADENQPITGAHYRIVMNENKDDGTGVRVIDIATLEKGNTLNFEWEIIR